MKIIRTSYAILLALCAFLILCCSTVLSFIPVFFLSIFKLIPVEKVQTGTARCIDAIAKIWISINNAFITYMLRPTLQIHQDCTIDPHASYFLIANHQSGCDILLLHWLFNHRLPMIRFFIKDQLKWVPLLGYCWWAMGFPFMKRYSSEYLKNKPHKKNHDQQCAQKSLELFKKVPTTIMSFVEGTRFTNEKQKAQQAPFKHLLMPRSGGISYAISTLHEQTQKILDVSIYYTKKKPGLWDFLTRRINTIKLHIREIPIPQEFLTGDLLTETEKMQAFRNWLNTQWGEKDRIMADLQCILSHNTETQTTQS